MIEKICGIYCIESIVDGKKYIGKAIYINRRIKRHFQNLRNGYHYNKYLQRVWDKYGEKNLKFYIVEICKTEELNNKEIFYIKFFNSMKEGFNNTLGGDGASGTSHTKEAKKKIGISASARNKGKTYSRSEESNEKSRISAVGRKNKKSTSKYSGVQRRKYFLAKEKKYKYYYETHFYSNGLNINLGNYQNEENAAKRWDEECWKIYHDLNKLNFPEDYENK
jgi:group I intron endonuclease